MIRGRPDEFAEAVQILAVVDVVVTTLASRCSGDGGEQEATALPSPASALALSCAEFDRSFKTWLDSRAFDRDDYVASELDEIAAARDTGTEGIFESAVREMAEEFRAGQARANAAGRALRRRWCVRTSHEAHAEPPVTSTPVKVKRPPDSRDTHAAWRTRDRWRSVDLCLNS